MSEYSVAPAPDAPLDLSQLDLLRGISTATLDTLRRTALARQFPAGRTVLVADAWGNGIYLITSGWVRVRQAVGDTLTTLTILGPQTFFGEMAILDEAPRSTDVVAMTSVDTWMIPAPQVAEILAKEPKVSYRLLQQMARRLRHMNAKAAIRDQSPVVRTLLTLTHLAEAQGKSTPEGILLVALPPTDLGDMAGVPASTAAHVLTKLASQGWLEQTPNQLLITHLPQIIKAIQR